MRNFIVREIEELYLTDRVTGEITIFYQKNKLDNNKSDETTPNTKVKITDIEILPAKEPDEQPKVTKVTFDDGKVEKMVRHEDDTFNLRECLFIATAKYLYKDEYTWEGIEYMATQLSYKKQYVKMVDKALKEYEKKMKELDKLKLNQENAKKAAENKKRKHAEYLKRREEKRINAQAQAVLRGLQMYDAEQNKKKVDYDGGECENTAS